MEILKKTDMTEVVKEVLKRRGYNVYDIEELSDDVITYYFDDMSLDRVETLINTISNSKVVYFYKATHRALREGDTVYMDIEIQMKVV